MERGEEEECLFVFIIWRRVNGKEFLLENIKRGIENFVLIFKIYN